MNTYGEQAQVPTVGIDTGKNTLHLIGVDEGGKFVLKKMSRGWLVARFANLRPCLISTPGR